MLVNVMSKMADDYLQAEYSLSFSRFRFLASCMSNPNASQATISEHLGVSTAVVNRMIPALKKKGYLTVDTDPTHGRKTIVNLTPQGKKVVTAASIKLDNFFIQSASDANVDIEKMQLDMLEVKNSLLEKGEIK